MKLPILRFLAVLAVIAIAFLSFMDKAAGAVRTLAAAAADFTLKVFTGPAPMVDAPASLADRPLLQARAFVQRLLKRERPVVTASWRMCPST